jgi:UDP-N-acetylglucosamine 4,6-dehydratase (inverting)
MNKNFFKNKSLLLTGGTGSFGKAFVNYLLKNKVPLKKIIIFSRDELKQFEMSKIYNENKFPCMRYFIGDVRDKERLKMAFREVDIVVHAAALKQVPIAEYNPIEYIKTNIIGAQNIIEASLDTKVQRVLALSTDKASSPINLYGATKLCSDKLFISANNIKGSKNLMFSVIRYGNVMGSRGSVLHNFIEQKSNKFFEVTDGKMTRFSITIDEAINFVIGRLFSMIGGEIFVPKIPSFRIIDLAKAVSEKCKIRITGIRPGEKLHEEMISTFDSINTVDLGNYYVILSSRMPNKYYKNFLKKEFSYRSDTNSHFLKTEDLRKMIKNFIS